MAIELFTIGDSISQGFLSGAAAEPEICYSSVLAKTLKIGGYEQQKWIKNYKFKYDIERILRSLESKYGDDISGLEWIGAVRQINKILDESEDYFERGAGQLGKAIRNAPDYYHNVAVEGMDVGDAFMVTPKVCRQIVDFSPKKERKDGYLHVANQSFARNAYRTLNPAAKTDFDEFSALNWLQHAARETGIENTIIWLGANNALGTVLDLDIKPTPGDGNSVLSASRTERLNWNLWHPKDFRAEYAEMLKRVLEAMKDNKYKDWHCYFGNVPLVTIAPLAKGIGAPRLIKDPAGSNREFRYYQNYTYFALSEEAAFKNNKFLKFSEALFIDKTIIQFNGIIEKLINECNQTLGREAFHLVDVSQSLTDMAWKRNSGQPSYQFPEFFDGIYPLVDTKYYHSDRNGKLRKGGIFSLDGVHPSAIGQGLIAWEFLKVIQEVTGNYQNAEIEWQSIFESDSLRNNPITLMSELYEHDGLLKLIGSITGLFGKKD